MSGLNAVHFFVISLITYLARNDCHLLSVEARYYCGYSASAYLPRGDDLCYIHWQKDTDENDDEFVDIIKLCDIFGNHYRQCLDLSLKHGEIIHFISIAVGWGFNGVDLRLSCGCTFGVLR